MKTFVLTLVIVALSNIVVAQNPTYILDANDGWQSGPYTYEFDIDITWTNPAVVSQFEYAGGQFFFDFNKDAIGSGTSWSMTIVSSDLPTNMQPRNPTIYTATTPGQLRFSVNTFPGAGNGFMLTANSSTKIIRARIQSNGGSFAQQPLNLAWRSVLPNPFTKIFAYVAGVNSEISTPPTHTMSIANEPLIAPQSFSIRTPENLSVFNSNTVHFSWELHFGHDSLRLVIARDTFFTNKLYDVTEFKDTIRDVYVRYAGIDLYAIVYSKSGNIINGVSNVVKFKIANNLSLISPNNSDSLLIYNPTFKWAKISSAFNYRLTIAEDSLFYAKIFEDSTITDTTKSVSGLKHRQHYYWRVTSKDTGNVVTAISPINRFRSVYPINLEVKCALQGMYNPLQGVLNRKDSITVYLRRATSPFQIVDSAKASIDTVSLIAYPGFKNAPAGSYYVVVKHFNSIETWSKVGGLSLQTNGFPLLYDFTASASQAYGNNMRLKGGKYCIYSGDVNQDGVIDGTDLSRIDNSAAFYQVGTRLPEDLDANGIVDANDFAIGDNNWYFITVITPMSFFDSEKQNDNDIPKVIP